MAEDFKGKNGGVLGPSGLSAADLDRQEAKAIRERGLSPIIKTRPHLGELFSSAYFVMHEQMKFYVDKLVGGEPLKESEVKAFTAVAKVLTDLSREERAQLDQMGEQQLSTKELLDLAKKAGLLDEGK